MNTIFLTLNITHQYSKKKNITKAYLITYSKEFLYKNFKYKQCICGSGTKSLGEIPGGSIRVQQLETDSCPKELNSILHTTLWGGVSTEEYVVTNMLQS